jgi:hypothetical protein
VEDFFVVKKLSIPDSIGYKNTLNCTGIKEINNMGKHTLKNQIKLGKIKPVKYNPYVRVQKNRMRNKDIIGGERRGCNCRLIIV